MNPPTPKKPDDATNASLRAQLASVQGQLVEAEETLSAIRRGEVDALVIQKTDGNEIYTLAGAERPYRRLVEAMNEGAAILSADGTVLYGNGRLAELLGYALATVLGGSFRRFLPADSEPTWRALVTGGPGERRGIATRLRRADGSTVPVLLSTSSLTDEDVSGICVVATDLTEQARAAETFANEARLRAANEALRDSDRRKDEFLAMLSHELRNPLAPIRTAVELLRLRTEHSPELARPLGVLARQTQHLSRLVDDLLEVSRITTGKIRLELETLDAALAVRRAVEISRPLVDSKHHDLAVTLPHEAIWIRADRTRLAQVLGNLLNNAAKYTDPGGRIRLSVERDGPDVVFRVSDNGVGIAVELLPRIFELFTQADTSLDRSQGGLGIGLTLVRGLVTLHGGVVQAHSEGAGLGSEFVVRLPALADEMRPRREPRTRRLAKTKPCRILVVDDNVDAAETLSELLRVSGHDVETAFDGAVAIDMIRKRVPDAVLLDIGLPQIDGYEVARRLRAENGARLWLVALTGYGQEEDRRRAETAGFDLYLVKPVDDEALASVLARVSEGRGATARP